jgi:predicted metal-dependent hydrolase
VKKRANWILKQIRFFERFHPVEPQKEYVSGETIKYLGRQYRIKVLISESNSVKLKGKYLQVYTIDQKKTKELIYRWYKDKAEIKFQSIADMNLKKLNKYGIYKPRIRIRKMRTRWGSCNTENESILLNIELIKAPIHCVEYVIMHELCHLKYPNHTKEFYNFLSLVMPDWRARKQRLEKGGL